MGDIARIIAVFFVVPQRINPIDIAHGRQLCITGLPLRVGAAVVHQVARLNQQVKRIGLQALQEAVPASCSPGPECLPSARCAWAAYRRHWAS